MVESERDDGKRTSIAKHPHFAATCQTASGLNVPAPNTELRRNGNGIVILKVYFVVYGRVFGGSWMSCFALHVWWPHGVVEETLLKQDQRRLSPGLKGSLVWIQMCNGERCIVNHELSSDDADAVGTVVLSFQGR